MDQLISDLCENQLQLYMKHGNVSDTTRTTFALKPRGSFMVIPKSMTCWTEGCGECLDGFKKHRSFYDNVCYIFRIWPITRTIKWSLRRWISSTSSTTQRPTFFKSRQDPRYLSFLHVSLPLYCYTYSITFHFYANNISGTHNSRIM